MRIAVWAAAGWLAGILVQGTFAVPAMVWPALALAVAAATVWRPSRPGLVVLAGCLGATVTGLAAPVPAAPEGTYEGMVARYPEEAAGSRRVLIDVDGGARVRVYEQGDRVAALLPGDRVRFRGQPRPPVGFDVEGAVDRVRFLRGRGIDLEATARLERLPGDVDVSAWRAAGWVRARAEAALEASSSGDGGALLAALVLGRRRDVSPALDESFRAAGVAHVLSVSGLHLAAVALLAFLLGRRLWLLSPSLTVRVPAESAAAAVSLAMAAAYTLVTGAEVATLRALLCAAVILGGKLLGRRGDALSSLAVAALALCALSPSVLYEPSFQLSFAAAMGLTLAARRGRGRLVSMVVTSLAATAATAPFCALHFGQVQPGGVLANLVVVPFAELVVLPLGLVGALLGAITPAAGASFIALGGLAAGALAWTVEHLGAMMPQLAVFPPRPQELALLCAAVLAILVGPWRRALAVAVPSLALVVVCYALEARPPDRLRVTFLDVGQGDSALVETPAGERWLIDGGGRLFGQGLDPGEQALLPFLGARRIDRLDVVVISHVHPDHVEGLAALAGRVAIGEVWLSGDGHFDRLGPARIVGAGHARRAGATTLEVLYPRAPDELRSVNDNSLVVRVLHGGRALLFAGDLEAAGEAALLAGGASRVDVVKVPHHGSRTSSTAVLVAALHPALAVVSCGRGNRFGFPAKEVVERWTAAGATVLRTDERGAITVEVDDRGRLAWSTRR